MARRPLPDRAMPHRVTIEPCTGYTDRGPTFGPAGPEVRANLNGGRGQGRMLETGVGDFSVVKTGEVTLDESVPVLSRITNAATGNSYIVGAVVDWDQPPVQPFSVASLGTLLV